MKFVKVLLYCSLGFLFACLFISFGVILVSTQQNSETNQNYVTPTITLNVGTGDRSVNQLPTLETISLSFPQYESSNQNIDVRIPDGCYNITVKVTAVNPVDLDGNISRIKFYYYDTANPEIIEYKESWIFSPFAYFVLPRTEKEGKEYRFGVILYDNNGGIIDSEDIVGKGPSIYLNPCE